MLGRPALHTAQPSTVNGLLDLELVHAAAGDADRALTIAAAYTTEVPFPGGGATAQRWDLLAGLAAADLTVARVVEAHLDAVAVLAEAGEPPPTGTWGVFAAEGPQSTLTLAPDGTVSGVKPWCSLGDRLDAALVTVRAGDDRRLVAVDLNHPGVTPAPATAWVSRGLAAVPSGPVAFDTVPARPVGEPGWYVTRPGFARGGMGVAACWFGGAAALAEAVVAGGRDDDVAALHAGEVDTLLHAAGAVLREAAATVDADQDTPLLASRVRAVVAAAAERVLTVAGHALGPAPLTFDETHARRVADLTVYVRQHHGERDLVALGRAMRDAGRRPS